MRLTSVVGLLLLAGTFGACREVTLPPAPRAPGPGSVAGRAVLPVPGRPDKRPAARAWVRLFETGLVTRADEDGLFVLDGITVTQGQLLLQHDADDDGAPERQRLLRLDGYRPGVGRQVQLGDVTLDENAAVRGRVRLADVPGASGHAGTLLLVPEGPYSTQTADDGTFLLGDLPSGTLRLAAFRPGYEVQGFDELQLSAGQELTLREFTLRRQTGTPPAGALRGSVALVPAGDATRVRLELQPAHGVARALAPQADGAFQVELPSELYRVTASLAGYASARLDNVLVLPGQTVRLAELVLREGTTPMPPNPAPYDAGVGGAGGTGGGGGGGGAAGAGGGAAGDGGQADAGPPDAGGGDAGPVDAGPMDAGAPTARFQASQVVRLGQQGVVLDGSGSVEERGLPLIFHWRQLQGPTVALSVNDTTQPTTRFDAPTSPGVLSFELVVENPFGLRSAPAAGLVSVQTPPTARVTPASARIPALDFVELDATQSSDPGGGALSYAWRVTSGALTLEALPDAGLGAGRVRARAGMTLGPGDVELVVQNAQGLRSDPVTAALVVHDDAPTMTLDAGLPQYVGLGRTVTLRAAATSSQSADVFSYQWTQTTAGGAAIPPDAGVALAGSGSVVSFAAPGVPTELFFRVSASAVPSGLAGTASTRVSVIDDVAPALVASDPPQAVGVPDGPWYRLFATFDEPLDVTSVVPGSVELLEDDAGVAVDTRWDPATNTVSVLPRRPLRAGANGVLRLTGLTDASPQRNLFGPLALPFRVRGPRHDAWSWQSAETNELRPAPLITSLSQTVAFAAFIGACGGNTAAYMLTPQADGGLTLGASTLCGCTRPEQRGHAVVGSRGYFLCSQGVALRSSAGWTQLSGVTSTNVLRSLNTDGVTVGSAQEGLNTSLNWASLTPTGVSPEVTVEADGGYAAISALATAYGGAVGGNRNLALGTTAARALHVFEQVAGGAWVNLSEPSPVGGSLMARGAYAGTRAVVCQNAQPSTQLLLRCLVRSGGAWIPHEDVAGGVVERIFDVAARGDAVYLAFSQGGLVRVRVLDTSLPGAAWADVPGPGGAQSWNLDPGCFAKTPALQLTDDAIWLAFQENCTANAIVALRRVQ